MWEEYEDESWSDGSRRQRWGLIALVVAALVVLMVGIGSVVVALGGDGPKRPAADTAALPAASASAEPPSPEASPEPPSPPPPPPPSPTPSKAAKVTPSKNTKATLPPPPPPPKPVTPGCVARTTGPQASYADVRSALKIAAGHTYWRSVPSIQVPERLLIAVAMTESTWRSNIVSCDGGLGLMQVMPATVTQINNRFGTTWDVNTLQGNAHLGGNYLAWSTRYLGDLYFGGSYDLGNPALLDAVIAGYNVGAGAVDPTKGDAGIPNWSYVNRVKGYLASCPCDGW
jgi:soluble lytic murein transglycosylase-like protein